MSRAKASPLCSWIKPKLRDGAGGGYGDYRRRGNRYRGVIDGLVRDDRPTSGSGAVIATPFPFDAIPLGYERDSCASFELPRRPAAPH